MRRSSPSRRPKVLGTVATDFEASADSASSRSEQADNEQGGRPRAPASLIAELESLDLALLRKRWRSQLRTPAPHSLSRPLLIRILAWRGQMLIAGDLDKAALSILEAAGGQTSGAAASPGVLGSRLRPGMVLVREHAGILHRVAVLTNGFAWNGGIFSSLSAVARAITGVNWNGPRFFGLDRPAPKQAVRGQGEGKGKSRRKESAPSASPAALPSQSHARASP